ncbi:unnamed protein product [Timema podura]|uniref:Nucleoprotein n=1 Tax=Timema podura TaxID=61482 RepID=A0ABN7NTL9_TIMPD|nr:unnamed protein product [Timema podura]
MCDKFAAKKPTVVMYDEQFSFYGQVIQDFDKIDTYYDVRCVRLLGSFIARFNSLLKISPKKKPSLGHWAVTINFLQEASNVNNVVTINLKPLIEAIKAHSMEWKQCISVRLANNTKEMMTDFRGTMEVEHFSPLLVFSNTLAFDTPTSGQILNLGYATQFAGMRAAGRLCTTLQHKAGGKKTSMEQLREEVKGPITTLESFKMVLQTITTIQKMAVSAELTYSEIVERYRTLKLHQVPEYHKNMVNVVGMRYLRNVCGKTRVDRVGNEWLLKECGLKGNSIERLPEAQPLDELKDSCAGVGGTVRVDPGWGKRKLVLET